MCNIHGFWQKLQESQKQVQVRACNKKNLQEYDEQGVKFLFEKGGSSDQIGDVSGELLLRSSNWVFLYIPMSQRILISLSWILTFSSSFTSQTSLFCFYFKGPPIFYSYCLVSFVSLEQRAWVRFQCVYKKKNVLTINQ